MDIQDKISLIKQGTEEILTEGDWIHFLKTRVPLNHYIGFEISGKIHLENFEEVDSSSR